MNVNQLTVKEKAELVEKLTMEIVSEVKGDAFAELSIANSQISGLMRTFGDSTYIHYASQLRRFIEKTDR